MVSDSGVTPVNHGPRPPHGLLPRGWASSSRRHGCRAPMGSGNPVDCGDLTESCAPSSLTPWLAAALAKLWALRASGAPGIAWAPAALWVLATRCAPACREGRRSTFQIKRVVLSAGCDTHCSRGTLDRKSSSNASGVGNVALMREAWRERQAHFKERGGEMYSETPTCLTPVATPSKHGRAQVPSVWHVGQQQAEACRRVVRPRRPQHGQLV